MTLDDSERRHLDEWVTVRDMNKKLFDEETNEPMKSWYKARIDSCNNLISRYESEM